MKAILRQVKEVCETSEITELILRLKTGKWIVFNVVEKQDGPKFILGRVA